MKNQKGKYTKRELDTIIKEADKNGDGKIDYDEFVMSMTR